MSVVIRSELCKSKIRNLYEEALVQLEWLEYDCMSITKELALNKREWKLAIYVPEPWSSVPPILLSFYVSFFSSFYSPFFVFQFFITFSPFFLFGSFSDLPFVLCFCLCFSAHLGFILSSLAYPNLLGTKRLDCCCCRYM
jgi:hypothetical protein